MNKSGKTKRVKFPKEFRKKIFERDNYECQRCFKNLIHLPEERVIDHKIPLSKGGSNAVANLWLLCNECDKRKNNNIEDDLMKEYISGKLSSLKMFNKDVRSGKRNKNL